MRVWLILGIAGILALAGCGRHQAGVSKNIPSTSDIARGSPHDGTLVHDGLTRTYVYYIPEQLPEGPVPLVFMLHGGGGWGDQVMASTANRWNELADQHGFVVIYPDGHNNRWNDCRADDRDPSGADDVGFINALIDDMAAKIPIDEQRIYVAGHSNGGMMAFRLGLELSNRLAAVASASGNIALHSECPAPSPLSVLYMMGTDDPLMPAHGGPITIPGLRTQGEVVSAADTVAFWTDGLSLKNPPLVTALPDLSTTDSSTVTLSEYTGGIKGAEMRYYQIDGGGHSLPGSITRPKNGAKNEDIVAVDEFWQFFSTKQRIKP